MSTYKVLIVDDSAFMRKIISDLIMEDLQFEVIGTARNGLEAVEMTRALRPDVVTMDVAMPIMNGLEALQIIMNDTPIPVIMLSSMTGVGTQETIRALELGAVDFIRKPSGSISLDLHIVKEHILDKLKIAVQAKVQSIRSKLERSSVSVKEMSHLSNGVLKEMEDKVIPFDHVVAIGTSTGGPRALQAVLSGLPQDFAAPVLIVQHMPPNFTKSLAIRLDTYCSLHVVEAEDGLRVSAGTVYIAPGGWHMSMIRQSDQFIIKLNKEEPRAGHRPSVDVLFESLIPLKEFKRHIIIMTGMGSDGAKSLKKLKESGANTTIAESEETCIVFGMPRAAIEFGGVDYILKQQEISNKLIELVQ